MVGKKLSASGLLKVEALTQGKRKLDRIHSLVEQYASMKKGQDAFAGMIARAATETGRLFMNNGYGVMADTANQIAMLAKRGGATASKFRGLREFVASLRQAMERAEKQIYAEEPGGGEAGKGGSE